VAGVITFAGLARADPARSAPSAAPGFLVERVSEQVRLRHPVAASFDDRGRLFVAEADRVVVLEDVDRDGRFDQSSVFADRLDPVGGVACLDGDVFVTSGQALLRLRDADGDATGESRTVILVGFASGTPGPRGPWIGPEGRVYAAAGGGAHEIRDSAGSSVHKGDMPVMVRCRPDGSGAEVIGVPETGFAAGITWTSAADVIVSSSIGNAPDVAQLTHFIEGDVPPSGAPRVDPLPPTVTGPPGGAGALLSYHGITMGRALRNCILWAQPGANRVRCVTLHRAGASYDASEEDLVRSADPDFRPVDVVEDADGSVLVIDRGSPGGDDAPGGVYRVRRDGAVRIADPRGLKLNWQKPTSDELVRRLDDLRPCVAERAVRELGKRGAAAVPVLVEATGRKTNPETRARLLWALAGFDGAGSNEAVRIALRDSSPAVRQVAAYVSGVRRDAGATLALIELLKQDNLAIRREAATALGRIGNPAPPAPAVPTAPEAGRAAAPEESAPAPAPVSTAVVPSAGPAATPPTLGPTSQPATQPATRPAGPPAPPSPAVPALLDALRGNGDRFLANAVVGALVRINDRESTRKGLADPDTSVQRAAKVALGVMETGSNP